MKACCIGCSGPSGSARPSMVVISRPVGRRRQASGRTARAGRRRCTVQAPHWPWSQPFFAPVRPRCSRNASSSVVRISSATRCSLPLTRSARPTGALACRGSWARTVFAEATRETAGKAADDAVATRKFLRLVLGAALPAAGGLGALGMTFLARFRSARGVTASRGPRNLLRINKACDGGFREHLPECGAGRRSARGDGARCRFTAVRAGTARTITATRCVSRLCLGYRRFSRAVPPGRRQEAMPSFPCSHNADRRLPFAGARP